jgi:hypothetical protein
LRRVLTRRAFATGCALALLVCGCSSGSGKAAPTTTRKPAATLPPTTRAPVTTTSTTTTTTTVPPADLLLESLVLKDAPSGFTRRPDSLADTGRTNLNKAAREDPLNNEQDARQLLVGAGFIRGHQRQWSTENAVGQNFIYVYQFATPEGATAYLSHWRAAVIADANATANGFAPVPFTPTIPGAMGLLSRIPRASSGVVLFAKGAFAVQAVVTGGPGVDERSPTTLLAVAQYALLP